MSECQSPSADPLPLTCFYPDHLHACTLHSATSELASELTSELTSKLTSELATELTSELTRELARKLTSELASELAIELASELTSERLLKSPVCIERKNTESAAHPRTSFQTSLFAVSQTARIPLNNSTSIDDKPKHAPKTKRSPVFSCGKGACV